MHLQNIFAVAILSFLFDFGKFEIARGSTKTIKTITLNACCEDTDRIEDIKRELLAVRELVNSILDENNCCCGHTKPATQPPVPQRDITTKPPTFPADCYDAQWHGQTISGIYTIQPDVGYEPFDVYCDMDTDGGGWTVFQRRVDGTVDFFRDWSDYQNGFGFLEGEFWLGNEKLYYLTYQYTQRLRVDLADFEGETRFAVYDHFSVGNSSDKYRLYLKFRSGNAGDALRYHDGSQFSTRDQDNDNGTDIDCAKYFKGGWWYQRCYEANLNGLYLGPNPSGDDGIEWLKWGRGYRSTLKFTEMKLRPYTWDD